MNRTRQQWAAINPDAFLDGSLVQARNVIEMMQQDIAELAAAVEFNADLYGKMKRAANRAIDILDSAPELEATLPSA